MNKKTIKLIILTSIFSSLLTSQVQGQNDANSLLKDIDTTYQNFSIELKPEGKLLKKLEAEKEKSSTEITEIDTTINDDSDKLIEDLEKLKLSVEDSEKKIITSLLLILKPSENKDNLGSIVQLLEDKKLDKKEICEDIQKPLKVESVTDANCGTFGNNTYTTIQQLFAENDNEIKTNIDKLKSSLKNQDKDKGNNNSPSEQKTGNTENNPDKSLFKEPLFIWTLINTILTLGLIGTFIWLYLFTKKIEQKTQELNKKNERRKQQIEQLKQREENRNQQINKMNDRILNLKNSLDNLSLNITNLVQTPPQINLGKTPQTTTLSESNNSQAQEETPPPVAETLPENVRLSYLFKQNPQSLIQNAIRVGMTKETLNKVISGTWEGVVELEASRQGEYYIVASNSGESYLFLDPNTTFNVPTLQNINKSQLFICHGDISQSFKGNEINITKPATVIKDNQNWRLMDSGEIQFN